MPKIEHPGLVVKALIEEYNLSSAKVAEEIQLSQSSIRLLINKKLKVSTPIALRLAKYFGKPVEYWIDLQSSYDLAEAGKDAKLSAVLKSIPKAKKQPPKTKAVKAAPAKAAKKGSRKPRAKK
ncbi:hypothetical protein FACS189450_01710 [Spirochaetia bacterium]|nr:hypothetical protein FACS189450_01710 [Spirochaetia bacterium]